MRRCIKYCAMIVFLVGLALLSFASPSAAKVAVVDTTWTTWPNTVYYFFGRNNTKQTLGPNAPYTDIKVHITAVDKYTLYINGKQIGSDDKWQTVETYPLTGSFAELYIAIKVENFGKGNGNGLMVDIEAGPDRFGTSTVKRRAEQVIKANVPTMVEYPARWYYFSGDIETTFNNSYKRTDWYNFDYNLFDDAAKLGFKWVMLGNIGNINYLPDNKVEVVTGYNGDVDSGVPTNGGIQLRRIDGEDIALKKPAQEQNLVDGDLTQGFNYVMDPLGTYKQVDLVQLYRVNKLVLYTGDTNPQNWPSYSVRGFSAQISLDNFRYEEVGVIHDTGVTNKDNGGFEHAEVTFPAQMTRYIRYFITESRLYPPNIGEMMVYGTGYTYSGVYESPAINFGTPNTQKNFSSISWTGDLPKGTGIVVQTATKYRLADGTPSAWSNWSPFHSETNFKFDSPEPATEFKYRVTLSTGNVDRTPVLKSLKVTYSQIDQPLASARASISPIAVPMGADTSFVFKLEYTLVSGTPKQDIKKIVISVPNFSKVDSVFSSETKKLVKFTSSSTNDSLYITLADSLVNADNKSPDILRVYLKTSILKNLHEFESFVYNSRANDGAGGINVWENTDESWTVKSNTVLADMLSDVKALPKAFTPNGDGVNDFTVFEFTLTKVDIPTPILIKIYSTEGTLVRELYNNRLSARNYRIPDGPTGLKAGSAADAKKLPGYWDGKNKDGKLVPPGVYIYQIIAKTDGGDKGKTGTVAVAY
ncbi:MAG: hypothetical protein Q8O92_01575 [Candidatus Latescibacter sp.]|nr:hypothetical protein [Candidatus Latescibacter sp.]